MTKDAFWFPHDAGARNDPKIVRLRRMHGHAGVGVYWYVVEMLREANDDGYELELKSVDDISYDGRFEANMIDSMIEIGLLDSSDTHFWSESLKRRMIRMDEIREKRAVAGAKGGKAKAKSSKSKASAKQLPSKRGSKALAKSSYDRIGQDRTVQDNTKEKKTPYSTDFESFWKTYPAVSRKAKGNAWKAWSKARKNGMPELGELLEILKNHERSPKWQEKNGQYIPHPATWINGERWEDEIAAPGSPQSNLSGPNLDGLTPQARKMALQDAVLRRSEEG